MADTVYISGKYGDSRVVKLADVFEDEGYTVALRWWELPVLKPYRTHRYVNIYYANLMRDALKVSSAFVLIPDPSMYGCLIELGMALAAGAACHIIGSTRESVFDTLQDVYRWDDIAEFKESMNLG